MLNFGYGNVLVATTAEGVLLAPLTAAIRTQ